MQARAWIEANVPAGVALGNFGGWAGDVRLRSFEGLWWEGSHFERAFGRERMDRVLAFLAGLEIPAPFYSYAVQRTNMAQAVGSMAEVERLETNWIVLHRHPLGYSRIDSVFARALADRAEQAMAVFSREVGHTTGLVQRNGDEVLEIRACVGSAPLRVVLPPGDSLPLFSAGTGRALMAWESDALIRDLWTPQAAGHFEEPPQSLDELMERIRRIRETGWEASITTSGDGISGVAVAFEGVETGERLCVYTVFSRLHVDEAERARIAEVLRRAVARVGRVLGPAMDVTPGAGGAGG